MRIRSRLRQNVPVSMLRNLTKSSTVRQPFLSKSTRSCRKAQRSRVPRSKPLQIFFCQNSLAFEYFLATESVGYWVSRTEQNGLCYQRLSSNYSLSSSQLRLMPSLVSSLLSLFHLVGSCRALKFSLELRSYSSQATCCLRWSTNRLVSTQLALGISALSYTLSAFGTSGTGRRQPQYRPASLTPTFVSEASLRKPDSLAPDDSLPPRLNLVTLAMLPTWTLGAGLASLSLDSTDLIISFCLELLVLAGCSSLYTGSCLKEGDSSPIRFFRIAERCPPSLGISMLSKFLGGDGLYSFGGTVTGRTFFFSASYWQRLSNFISRRRFSSSERLIFSCIFLISSSRSLPLLRMYQPLLVLVTLLFTSDRLPIIMELFIGITLCARSNFPSAGFWAYMECRRLSSFFSGRGGLEMKDCLVSCCCWQAGDMKLYEILSQLRDWPPKKLLFISFSESLLAFSRSLFICSAGCWTYRLVAPTDTSPPICLSFSLRQFRICLIFMLILSMDSTRGSSSALLPKLGISEDSIVEALLADLPRSSSARRLLRISLTCSARASDSLGLLAEPIILSEQRPASLVSQLLRLMLCAFCSEPIPSPSSLFFIIPSLMGV